MDAQAQLLFDKLDLEEDGEDLEDFKSIFSSKRFNASRTSEQHAQETSRYVQESATYVQQQATPPFKLESQILYEPPVFLQQQVTATSYGQSVNPATHASPHQAMANATNSGTYSANAIEVTTHSAPPVPAVNGVATSNTHVVSPPQMTMRSSAYSGPAMDLFQDLEMLESSTTIMLQPLSPATCVTLTPQSVRARAFTQQTSCQPPQQSASLSVLQPSQPGILSVATTIAKSAQTFSPSIAPSSFPQPSAQAITGATGPPHMVSAQTASAQMASQPQQTTRRQLGSGMSSQGASAPVMTYETPASQVLSPPRVAPPQMTPQQTEPQQMSCGMFSHGAAPSVTSQKSSPPRIAPLHMAPPKMVPQPPQTAPQQMGSGTFAQGAAASVMTSKAPKVQVSIPRENSPALQPEAPTRQVPSPRVNSPALQADIVTESKLGSPQAGGGHKAKDDAIRNKFKNWVMEAVSQGEEMITIPTKMVIRLLEMVLPESERADLKPIKVTKSRIKGRCC